MKFIKTRPNWTVSTSVAFNCSCRIRSGRVRKNSNRNNNNDNKSNIIKKKMCGEFFHSESCFLLVASLINHPKKCLSHCIEPENSCFFLVSFLFDVRCVMSNVDDYYDVMCFGNGATIKDTHTATHAKRCWYTARYARHFTNTLSHLHSNELFWTWCVCFPKQFFGPLHLRT